MQYVKIGLIGCLLALLGLGADLSGMQALLQSIASGDETLAASNLESFGDRDEDAIRAATPEQIRPLLAPARQCLHSPKRPIRAIGVSLFLMVVLLRPADNRKLLDSYVDDLAALLDDPDEGLRNGTVGILGRIFPKPPPNALAYLEGHLNDKANDDITAGMIAGALLHSGNAALISEVLRFAEQRPHLKGAIIQSLGLYQIATDEALKFIHSAFQDSSLYQVAVDAVRGLPRDARKGFAQDLGHVIEDPNTDPRVAEGARQALTQ